jgi:hypothetical protein
MGEISEVRMGAVRKLIAQAPDRMISSLESVLASVPAGDRSLALVQELITAEKRDRRLRQNVFAPIAPHCESNPALIGRVSFPPRTLALAWAAAKASQPDLVEEAVRGALALRPLDEAPPEFDQICLRVVRGLESGEPAFADLERLLGSAKAAFCQSLALAPVVRSVLPKLPVWVSTLSNEPAAAIRLAFKDATDVKEDSGPAFMELLYGHLDEPWQVLRLMSLVMDRPSDSYLAASELAPFGERLLNALDARIESIRRFDATRGLEAGVEASASVQFAVSVIGEFEQWLAVSREGPWGRRLNAQKRSLAAAAESRLREAEAAVNVLLPVRAARRGVRGEPNLADPVNAAAFGKAQALLAFVYETRGSANYAGFASARAKLIEAIDPRVDTYADDLLELLHAGEGDLERVRAFIEVAAELLGLLREPRATEILRRRAAAA